MTLASLESEVVGTVDRLSPSVVRVDTGGPRRGGGTGSGLAVGPPGHVVTNAHVVRKARRLSVLSASGERVDAELVGKDDATDVALLRVPRASWPVAPLGDSEALRVGQFVVAVGNSLGLPGAPTVSLGVVSALGRPLPGSDFIFEGLIQTDAAINPGNSGGPLADLRGAVVGLNTAMIPFAQGVGFAVPVNTVRRAVDQILRVGRVIRPWLGVTAVGIDAALAARLGLADRRGVYVGEVTPGSPAEAAGVGAGDVVRRLGGVDIGSVRDLLYRLSGLPVGGAVDLEFLRGGSPARTIVRLAEAPA